MFSFEYTYTLLPQANLTGRQRPALVVGHSSPEFSRPDPQRLLVILDQPLTLLGRDEECAVRLNDHYVSRYHASIVCEEGERERYWLWDGGEQRPPSANGVFVNGRRLSQAYDLQDGERIRLGKRSSILFQEIRHPTPADVQRHAFLPELLQAAGLLTEEQLVMAQEAQSQSQLLLGEVMVLQGWVLPETVEFFLQDPLRQPLKAGKHPIADYLKLAGLVSHAQMSEATRIQKEERIYFGKILVERGYLQKQTLTFFVNRYAVQEGYE